MVLDEPKETDEVFRINGFTMLVDKDLHEQTKDITVDYGMHGCGQGFQLSAQIPIRGASGGSCSC
jgi:iron-sulfur cluster assembly protein